MRYIILGLNIILVLSVLMLAENMHTNMFTRTPKSIPVKILTQTPTDVDRFLSRMAMRESGNNALATNKFGMIGKYQFSQRTISDLGFKVSRDEFLRNSKLQDSVMIANMRENSKVLSNIIHTYSGTKVKGIYVTKSGILAAAHFGGPQSVINFFRDTNWNGRTDANGASIREYMKLFSGYKLVNI